MIRALVVVGRSISSVTVKMRKAYFMKKLFFITIIFLSTKAWSQPDTGSVIIHKDPRLDLLVKKQAQINEETTRENRRTGPGFRIQIISTTDRAKAIAAKTKIYRSYPELKPYFLYQSPYYRLKVGNFKTREEAEEYIPSLSRDFANAVFIVKDMIEHEP